VWLAIFFSAENFDLTGFGVKNYLICVALWLYVFVFLKIFITPTLKMRAMPSG